jgi:hypothetical protein
MANEERIPISVRKHAGLNRLKKEVCAGANLLRNQISDSGLKAHISNLRLEFT